MQRPLATIMLFLAVLLASYLIGAIPFGYLIARSVAGIDIRQHGSGNIGATNVGRVLGWPFFVLVFALDFGKGAGPVLAARWLSDGGAASPTDLIGADELAIGAGLAAILGHMWPIYLAFRGGKGVATSAGVISILLPWPTLIAVITWGVVLLLTRYVSASSLAAALALCAARAVQTWPEPFAAANRSLTVFCLLGVGLVVLRHRGNLQRLWQGRELKVGRHPPPAATA